MFKRVFMIPCEEFDNVAIRTCLKYGKILYSETIFENNQYYEVVWLKCSLRRCFAIGRRFKKKEKGVYYISSGDAEDNGGEL